MKAIQREQAERTPSGLSGRFMRVGTVLLVAVAFLAVLMMVASVVVLAAPTGTALMTYVVAGIDLGLLLLFIGIIFVLVGIGISRASMGTHPILAAAAVIIGIVAFVGLAVYVLVPSGGPGTTPSGIPQSDYTILASVDTSLGSASAPGGAYSSANTVVGGTTCLWTTTEGTFDSTSNTFLAREHVDTAVAVGPLFMQPLCVSMKFQATLKNPYTAPGTGTAYTYTYGMKVLSISRTVLNQDGNPVNRTSQNVFYQDPTSATNGGDWYLLYKNNAGTWQGACTEYRASVQLGGSCGQVALGGESSVASTDTFYFYIVLNQVGFAGYTQPSVGSILTIQFQFGAADGSLVPHTYTLQYSLNARDTSANT